MDIADQMREEDHSEFENALSETLYAQRAELHEVEDVLDADQLRSAALEELPDIAAPAAGEYQRYVHVRDRVRAASTPAKRPSERRGRSPRASVMLSGTLGKPAGLGPVTAVLAPILAGAAAVIFLIVGYALGVVSPEPQVAGALRTAGWLFAGLSVATFVIAMVALMLTALRHSSASRHETPATQRELARAKEAWRTALIERGIQPYLAEQLDQARRHQRRHGSALEPDDEEQSYHPGYSSPSFSTNPESVDQEGGVPESVGQEQQPASLPWEGGAGPPGRGTREELDSTRGGVLGAIESGITRRRRRRVMEQEPPAADDSEPADGSELEAPPTRSRRLGRQRGPQRPN